MMMEGRTDGCMICMIQDSADATHTENTTTHNTHIQTPNSVQAAIADLLGRIEGITQRAAQSEAMVQEICRDIRQLDCAKRNLQTTITALKRYGWRFMNGCVFLKNK